MLPSNKGDVIKLSENQPPYVHWNEAMIKTAVRICMNNGFTHIPSPEEIAALPTLWTDDILNIYDQIKFQLSHLKANQPDG